MEDTLNFYQSNVRIKLTNEIRSFLSGVLIFEVRHVFVEGYSLRELEVNSVFSVKESFGSLEKMVSLLRFSVIYSACEQ